jgi:hypothetical protein
MAGPTTDPWRGNAFLVLGASPDASRMELERQGQKLLGLLEIGSASAKHYRTPLATYDRTSDDVREAIAALRDPNTRLAHALMAEAPLGDAPPPLEETKPKVPLLPLVLRAHARRT